MPATTERIETNHASARPAIASRTSGSTTYLAPTLGAAPIHGTMHLSRFAEAKVAPRR